jgi:hypothetical protein
VISATVPQAGAADNNDVQPSFYARIGPVLFLHSEIQRVTALYNF